MDTENKSSSSPNFTDGILDSTTQDMEFVETHGDYVKAVFVLIACVSLFGSSMAVIVMQQTKKTPYIAKLLSTGLLTFDALFIVLSTVRKFITNTTLNLNVQVIVFMLLQLVQITIGMMAVERCILIYKPMYYLNHFSKRKVKVLVFSVWIVNVLLTLFVRYGVCYFHNRTLDVFIVPAVCNKVISFYYGTMVVIGVPIPVVCYSVIAKCLYGQLNRTTTFRDQHEFSLHKLKTTSLSFAYLVVTLVILIAYIIIIAFVNIGKLKLDRLRLAVEVVSLINCLLDPFLYVFWFKESRLILLKICSHCCTRLQPRVSEMRIEVYSIVVAERYDKSNNTTTTVPGNASSSKL